MGIRRNLGAALTMGAMATTKLKEAQKQYKSRLDQDGSLTGKFNALCESVSSKFKEMNGSLGPSKSHPD